MSKFGANWCRLVGFMVIALKELAMADSLKEKDVWKHFRKTWPWHAERQEPGAGYDAGKPDVLLLDRKGVPGLVELKAPARIQLRPSQWIWHERWVLAGGKSCVVSCQIYEGERKPVWFVAKVDKSTIKTRRLAPISLSKDNMLYIVCKVLGLAIPPGDTL
jgi:hypothetical protein